MTQDRNRHHKKIGLRQQIVECRKQHPEYVLQEIAEIFTVSPQRVYQILSEEGAETKASKVVANGT